MSSARSTSPCSFSITRAITSISGSASRLWPNFGSDAAYASTSWFQPPVSPARRSISRADLLGLVILGERLEPPAERRALVAQLLLVVLREPLHALLARDLLVRRRRAQLDLEHAHERLADRARLVQRDQGLGRGEVVLVELEHLLERAHRAIGLLHLVAVEHRDLHRERRADAVSLPASTSRSSTRMYSSILPRDGRTPRDRPSGLR